MMIWHDPDEDETTYERRTCPFHEQYPQKAFAGCTCSFAISSRRRSPEEVAKIKADRRREEEDRILAQAEIIKARREQTP